VVEHYSVDKLGEESKSSDKEEEEVKEINTTEALKSLETLKLWKLQKGNNQDLQALDRLKREIVRYKSSLATQTTIYAFLSQFLNIRIPPHILMKLRSRSYSYMEVLLYKAKRGFVFISRK
jgi:hypothetical protein